MNEERADGREHDAGLNAVEEDESHRLSLLYLTLLALALGIVTGLGAVLFRDLIGLIHNLVLRRALRRPLRRQRLHRRRRRWGALVILVAGDRRRSSSPSWSATSRPRPRATACPR